MTAIPPGQEPVPAAQTPAPKIVYVSFSAEISVNTTESLIALACQCAAQGVTEMYLMLSTPGGTVMHGMNLYNILRAMPFTLTVHNVGNVDSIGNAVFLAGAKRYASPHSTFMFHGVGFDIQGPARFEEKMIRERLAGLLSDQKRIGAVIQERTKLTEEQVEALFREAQTKDAAYAVGCGIIDEVRDVQIPAGSAILSLVFQR